MKLQGAALMTELERLLETPGLGLNDQVKFRCQLAKELEESGNYEAAREALNGLWHRIGERPKLEGLERSAQAEVLLRAGCLSGWIGSALQVEGAQEIAKNLISESEAMYVELKLPEKSAEALTDLAYCYWREGAFDEARSILRKVDSILDDSDGEVKAVAIIRSAIVEMSDGRPHESLSILRAEAPFIECFINDSIKGRYHLALANTLNYLSEAEPEGQQEYGDRALIEYTAASFHFREVGHTRYLSRVENNIGHLLFELGRFQDAHEHLDHARRLFVSLKDSGSIAQVDETRARALLAQGRPEEAEPIARASVSNLDKGDEHSLLALALTTHATALARIGQYDQAQIELYKAVEITERAGDKESAARASLALIEEVGDNLSTDEMVRAYHIADSYVSRALKPELLNRLRLCANQIIAKEIILLSGQEKVPKLKEWSGNSLSEEMLRYEGELIKLSLRKAEGKITHAARLLGITYQGLQNILKNRHKGLLGERRPFKVHRKSIIPPDKR